MPSIPRAVPACSAKEAVLRIQRIALPLLWILLWILGPAACAESSGQDTPGADSAQADRQPELEAFFAARPHASFRWTEAKGVSERAALNIPVDLDGVEGWFQLDTGLDVTLIYGDLPAKRGWDEFDGMVRVPALKIGEMELGPAWFRTRPEHDTSGDRLGSLGLDYLAGKVLLIDFPGQRLILTDFGDLPGALLARMTWTPAEIRDAKFFINTVISRQGVEGIFFDTGTSAFDLTVDLATWLVLTDRASPDEATVRKQVNSWGKKITMLGAPATGPLLIGSARIQEPMIYTIEERPDLFATWPFPATGLVGNAPFWDRVVVMDLGLRPRFGILE